MDSTQEKYRAPAVEKAIDVLEALAEHEGGMTIKDIAAAVNRSIGEIFRVILVMERRGLLYKNPSTDVYTATHKLLELGFRSTPAQRIGHIAYPIMYQLSRASEQSCHLVIAEPGRALVIAQQQGTGPTGFGVRLGALLDLQDSASGNVILALSDPQQRETLLNGEKLRPEVAARLQHIAAAGLEQRESLRSQGVRDISCPIFGFDSRVAGALTVPYLTLIDGSQQLDEDGTRELLVRASGQISAELGYSGPNPAAAGHPR